MGEIVDGKKWDGERKVVVYEVKGQWFEIHRGEMKTLWQIEDL